LKKGLIGLLILLFAATAWGQSPPAQSPKTYAKNRQWKNVMDYGAKNDSTSGAVTIGAFNLAETAAGAYGTVYIPAGQFLLDTTWTIGTSNVKIVCAEGARLYFPIEAQASHCYNGVVFDSVSNVEWTGGFIVGNADSLALVANVQSRANGMYLKRADGVVISDVEVRGFEYGIRISGDPNYSGGGQSQHCILDGAKVHHNQRDNIIIENASYNTVRNCQSWEAGYIDYGGDNEYLSWNANAGDVGSGIAVRQFTFIGGTEDTSWYNVIDGNEIWNCRGQGIIVWRQDSLTQDARHTTITNNVIHDVRYSGINLASAPNSIVDHNTIWDCNRPNDMAGNVYVEATYNNDGIHIELWSNKVTVYANTVFDTKVYDPADPDEAITYAGVQLGDGSPKDSANVESKIEPAPDSCVIINNVFYNTKRYQKSILDSAVNGFTHQEIDGFVVDGDLSGANNDTLYRTDTRLYRDGRDNMAIDTFSFPTAVIYGNKFMASPYMEIGGYPVKGTPTDDYVLTFDATDSTWNAEAAPGAAGGETNTLADTGTFNGTEGFGLAGGKTGSALKVKGLIEGAGITFTASGDSAYTVASSGGAVDSAVIGTIVSDTGSTLYQPINTVDSDLVGPIVRDTGDIRYLRLSGGTMAGDINVSDNKKIYGYSARDGGTEHSIFFTPDSLYGETDGLAGSTGRWVWASDQLRAAAGGSFTIGSGVAWGGDAIGNGYFSAYSDLGAESKIGTGAAQVAAGNHDHSGTYLEEVYTTDSVASLGISVVDDTIFISPSDGDTCKYYDDGDGMVVDCGSGITVADSLKTLGRVVMTMGANASDTVSFPLTGLTDNYILKYDAATKALAWEADGGGGSTAWGDITGKPDSLSELGDAIETGDLATAVSDDIAEGVTAYGWGDHASGGYESVTNVALIGDDTANFLAAWDSAQALDETYETITEVAKIGDDTANFLRAVDSVDAQDETYETISNVALIGDDTTDFLRAVDSADALDETYETIANVGLIGDDTTDFLRAVDSVDAADETYETISNVALIGDDTADWNGVYTDYSDGWEDADMAANTLDTSSFAHAPLGKLIRDTVIADEEALEGVLDVAELQGKSIADAYRADSTVADSAYSTKGYTDDAVQDVALNDALIQGKFEVTATMNTWNWRWAPSVLFDYGSSTWKAYAARPDTNLQWPTDTVVTNYTADDSSAAYAAGHPDIIHIPDGWPRNAGYGSGASWGRWTDIFAFTPLHSQLNEDPFILVFDPYDSTYKELYVGTDSLPGIGYNDSTLDNPVFTEDDVDANYLSDVNLDYTHDGKLLLTFRGTYYSSPDIQRVFNAYSSDGLTWAVDTIAETTGTQQLLSPSMVVMGEDQYTMFAVDGGHDPNKVVMWSGTNYDADFEFVDTCHITPPTSMDIWHMKVRALSSKHLVMLAYCIPSGNAGTGTPNGLYWYWSEDGGKNWVKASDRFLYNNSGWCSANLYRASWVWEWTAQGLCADMVYGARTINNEFDRWSVGRTRVYLYPNPLTSGDTTSLLATRGWANDRFKVLKSEELPITTVGSHSVAATDSVKLLWYHNYGAVPATDAPDLYLFLDSSYDVSANVRDQVVLDYTFPEPYTTDSIIFWYLTDGKIDTISLYCPYDSTNELMITEYYPEKADSLLAHITTEWTSTTYTRAAIPCSRIWLKGDRLCIVFRNVFAQTSDRIWMKAVSIKAEKTS